MKQKIWLSWSSGKDSAWALHVLRGQNEYEVAGLVTTVNRAFDRVAMHSTRRTLVEQQAESVGLPIKIVDLPWPCSNTEYERIMQTVCRDAIFKEIEGVAFGDLFLAEIRAYRERQLKDTGLEPIFPLWQMPTRDLARSMIAGGLRAKLVCIDPAKLPAEFAGRDFDEDFLAALPPEVDPCGENGEFHSFVYAGPMFKREIPVVAGERVHRDGFWFCDVAPVKQKSVYKP